MTSHLGAGMDGAGYRQPKQHCSTSSCKRNAEGLQCCSINDARTPARQRYQPRGSWHARMAAKQRQGPAIRVLTTMPRKGHL